MTKVIVLLGYKRIPDQLHQINLMIRIQYNYMATGYQMITVDLSRNVCSPIESVS